MAGVTTIDATTLEGADLDLAVVRAEGYRFNGYDLPYDGCDLKDEVVEDHRHFKPSTEWKHGGPIIEREMICLTRAAFPDPEFGHQPWIAESVEGLFTQYGDTALIAAMRCYVAMKSGSAVIDRIPHP